MSFDRWRRFYDAKSNLWPSSGKRSSARWNEFPIYFGRGDNVFGKKNIAYFSEFSRSDYRMFKTIESFVGIYNKAWFNDRN